MDQFNISHDYAYESPTLQLHPAISEDVFQWKSKQKPKKGKVLNDDGKTDATSEMSTNDETCDASTVVGSTSNPIQSHSSHSTLTKKCKKCDRQVTNKGSEPLECAHTDVNVIFHSTPSEKPVEHTEYSPFVTLSCPVCSDPECVLNVASSCPLLRYNEKNVTKCRLCEANCECIKCKSKLLPVSGLVARDENGIAETLLKQNGGPIENSSEWANRKRWIVPYGISWEHQVGEWVTSRMLDPSKTTLDGVHRKRSRSKFGKRKSKHSSPTGNSSQVVMSNDKSTQEDKGGEPKVLLEGNGFKIFARGHEKVLVNFDRKNCKFLGCSCKTDSPIPNCGCEDWREEGQHKKYNKKDKSCRMSKHSGKVSLVKETSHGYVEETIRELDKVDKEARGVLVDKIESTGSKIEKSKGDKTEGLETQARPENTKEKSPEEHGDKKGKKVHDEETSSIRSGLKGLSARDVRNTSRADVLEDHLRSTLGVAYKSESKPNEQFAVGPARGCAMNPPPGHAMEEVTKAPMEMLGPCMCAERYCYTSA